MFDKIETIYGPIFFPSQKPKGTTGVAFSGGVESTLILYLLCLRNQVPDRIFRVDNNKKLELVHCNLVLEWLNKKFKLNLCVENIKRNDTAHHDLKSDMLTCASYVDHLYIGSNTQPSPDINIGSRPERLTIRYPNPPAIEPFIIPKIIEPFFVYDKRVSVLLYFQLGIEDLFNLTRSCADPNTKKPCTLCFGCRDRKWALSYVSKN